MEKVGRHILPQREPSFGCERFVEYPAEIHSGAVELNGATPK